MSIEAAIVSALAGVAGGRIFPQVAPEKAAKPFVVYRIKSQPIRALSGMLLGYRTTAVFECWAASFQSAIDTAAAADAALAIALPGLPVEPPDDDYTAELDEYVRPLAYEFVAAP